jgi:hypothetical protein
MGLNLSSAISMIGSFQHISNVRSCIIPAGKRTGRKPPIAADRSLNQWTASNRHPVSNGLYRLLTEAFRGRPGPDWRPNRAQRDRGRPWRDGPRTGGSALDALADIGHSSPFVFVLRSAEFLGESDEKPFRPTHVAEPIRVFILDYFAHELRRACGAFQASRRCRPRRT